MPHYAINPGKTALIVYDMTNTFVAEGGEFATREARQTLVPRLVPFIGKCRAAGILVVFVRQVLAADGSDAGRLDDIYPGRLAPFHAGGGGFHPPEERDVERVLDDVRNGYVSRDAASRLYKRDIDQADPLTKNSAS